MICPFCSHEDTRVVDSRLTRDGLQIRRRRQCESCGSRFNTFESPELKAPRIVKSDGGREAFSEEKLREGMMRALEKRPVSTEATDAAINHITRRLMAAGESEVSSRQIGELVMDELNKLDQGA